MRSYPLEEARTELSKVVERALAGEPQRVTRDGEGAVIIVAESDWREQPRSRENLGEFLARHAESCSGGEEALAERPFAQSKPLGADFVGDA
jgi:prevent-host-death family protein